MATRFGAFSIIWPAKAENDSPMSSANTLTGALLNAVQLSSGARRSSITVMYSSDGGAACISCCNAATRCGSGAGFSISEAIWLIVHPRLMELPTPSIKLVWPSSTTSNACEGSKRGAPPACACGSSTTSKGWVGSNAIIGLGHPCPLIGTWGTPLEIK
jgi:hypothetical protein